MRLPCFLHLLPQRMRHVAVVAWAASAVLSASAQSLPPDVQTAFARANVPLEAVSVVLIGAEGRAAPRIAHRSTAAMNPASVIKLLTTYAALDVLGPAYTWRTPVYIDGSVHKGVLRGNLYIQGQGDPQLVLERLWALLRRVQGVGIHTIKGDIVLDNSAFSVPASDPAEFDGEPLRPYNATPDALLINYKALVMTFTPAANGRLAYVQYDPPLAGVAMQRTVPIASDGSCADYRSTLQAEVDNAVRIRLRGTYPADCAEKVWPIAYADPDSYARRAIQGMWQHIGGRLQGKVRTGKVPPATAASAPMFEVNSAPLSEVIRDINKFSNNVMAQQVFFTLGRNTLDGSPSTPETSRAALEQWWREHLGADNLPTLDNGSGLSRDGRISAHALVQLLRHAYASPLMPELMASLPINGVDGTLKRMKANTSGVAHLKTGSLHDVLAMAGYVHGASGKRYVLVALVNHPNANAARPAMASLVDWAVQDR